LQWIEQKHLDVLAGLLEHADGRIDRRALRELLLGLIATRNAEEIARIYAEEFADPQAPLIETDLTDIETLLTKGIRHNGLVPELSATQVGRSVRVVSELLRRAAVSAVSQEQIGLLEQVFDHVLDAPDAPVAAVRQLERIVRAGLGLRQRVTQLPAMPAQTS
jgi:hypothetical protein